MRISPRGLLLIAPVLCCLTSCTEKAAPPRTYGLGDKVTLGHLVYSAYETQWLTHIGEGAAQRVPQNRFFLVRMTIANSGNDTVTAPTLSVVDNSGGTVQELSDGEGVPQWIGFLRQLGKGATAQGNLAFDVPPRHYKLRVSDEEGQKTAFIDLPLEFNPETPDLP